MIPQETIFRFLKHDCNLQQGKALFSYELQTPTQTYSFTEELRFQPTTISDTKQDVLNSVLDMLLLVMGVSYWKTTCATTIVLPESITLNKNQADFWNTVYTKGLGEFYFTNQIDFRGLVNFPSVEQSVILNESEESHSINKDPSAKPQDDKIKQPNNRSLVFFGGGKDSIVSVEQLKKGNKPFDLFVVNQSEIQRQTAAQTGKEVVEIKRIVDARLIELNNKDGIYNGHVPVSAIWACIGLFTAILYDYRYLVVSNEKSANYGNVEYLGIEVNHQWSKSEEFEHLFATYVHKYITPDITYFSFLRPIHEIKIAELFAAYPQYFPYFSSCNKNFKIVDPLTAKRWCGECPKCLFVFILLSAFLQRETLVQMFGVNLFENQQLLPLMDQLTGTKDVKPFECVGTPEETLLALSLAHEKGVYEQDFLMEHAKNEVLPIIKNLDTLRGSLLAAPNTEILPPSFRNLL